MADKILVELALKNPMTDDQTEEVKSGFKKFLKAMVKKEKAKGKKLKWVVIAKQPEMLTEDAIKTVFKKCKLAKELRSATVTA